ncbi:hypothetical protein HB662_02190 [Roseomonas frigidaquae]|uniref:Uncharacterized protein n=1 Tax=Falsiroseomonas frigidaquae TaxID=487318 RepID=A0ABX1EUI1_9PROT|nr:hypothetical protein [Falsiroseomonas frigidaquae]NKE43569.1 hypothetical protein [Falsiroseomonas frigidaquae]
MSADLEVGYERHPVGTERFRAGKTYLRRRSTGDLDISVGPCNITLGGKYQTIISVTKEDTLRLMAEAFKGEPFGQVIAELAAAMAETD